MIWLIASTVLYATLGWWYCCCCWQRLNWQFTTQDGFTQSSRRDHCGFNRNGLSRDWKHSVTQSRPASVEHWHRVIIITCTLAVLTEARSGSRYLRHDVCWQTFVFCLCPLYIKHVAQLSQRDRAAGWVSYGQKWKTGTGIQYFTDIIGLPSTTVT